MSSSSDELMGSDFEEEPVRDDTPQYPPNELRTLLFGSPLSNRTDADPEELAATLDECLRAVMVLLEERVGLSEALEQTNMEFRRLMRTPVTAGGIAARRAALLFALHQEEAIRAHFARTDPELVKDLAERVLPMTIPSFVAGMAQAPDALVVLVTLLVELWPGEPMGRGLNQEEADEETVGQMVGEA